MKLLVLFLLLSVVCAEQFSLEALFEQFKVDYQKVYNTKAEDQLRFDIFCDNLKYVEDLKDKEQQQHVYGITKFFDLTPKEFASTYLMKDCSKPNMEKLKGDKKQTEATPPSVWDWRDKGAVTPVYDQYSCGTCWAFSTAQNIEGTWFLAGNDLVGLSTEQISDCDPYDCGMFGGWPHQAYQYVIENGGLVSSDDYPYCCGARDTCYPCMAPGFNRTLCGSHATLYCNETWSDQQCEMSSNSKNIAATISGWKSLSSDEVQLQSDLGPLSTCFNAERLQWYKKGIWNPSFCDPEGLDHCVLFVGYGTEDGQDYWVVKNSWGESWGEDGYFKIVRGQGKCGINTMVTTSII